MNLWQQLVAVIRDLPRWIGDGTDKSIIDTHMPINWRDRAPGEDLGPCLVCRKSWPCRHWSAAWDRRGARLHREQQRATDR